MVKHLLLFLGLFLLVLFVYCNGLHIPYYFDDFEHVFTDPGKAMAESFSQANGFAHFYRPIEKSFLAWTQLTYGMETFPIRLLHLILHASAAYLVFHMLRKFGVSNGASFTGTLFVTFSQLSGYVVLSNDTLSQIMGSLCSALSVWLVLEFLSAKDPKKGGIYYISSIFFFLTALFSKETSAGVLFALAFLFFSDRGSRRSSANVSKSGLRLAPFVLCFLLYWIIRSAAGGMMPTVGTDGHGFFFGLNILRNAGLLLLQGCLPVSSVTLMRALEERSIAEIILIALCWCTFAGFFFNGIFRSARRREVRVLGIFILCSCIPFIFLGSVSELYPYNMIVYLGALVGIATEYYLLNALRKSWHIVLLLFLASIAVSNAFGINEKAELMRSQGKRAKALLPQVVTIARSLPEKSTLYLIDPPDKSFTYSQFVMRGFSVLSTSDSLIRFLSGRSDVSVSLATRPEYIQESVLKSGPAYSYDLRTLRLLPLDSIETGSR